MPAPRVLPGREELGGMLARGMTHADIAEYVYQRTGHRPTQSAISQARKRYNLHEERVRYEDLVPWRVREDHAMALEARMLRAEARRRRGEALPEALERRLNAWLVRLQEKNAVVAYYRDTEEGWFYVPRSVDDTDIIRKPEVQ